MKGNYITNENISNNIMFHNSNYSLKERRNPYNHNNIMVYSLTGRRKPEPKYHKVNVQQNSLQQKKRTPNCRRRYRLSYVIFPEK